MKSVLNLKKPNIFKMLFVAIVCSYLGILLYYITPFFTGYLIDQVIATQRTDLIVVWLGLGLIFGLIMHSYLFYFLKFIWDKSSTLLANEVRVDLSTKLHQIKPFQYEQFNHGYLFNLFIQDTSTVGSITLRYIASSTVSILRIVTCIIILAFIQPKLTLISLTFIPLYLLAMLVNRKQLEDASTQERKQFDSFVFYVRKIIEGKIHINLFKKEFYFSRLFGNYLQRWTSYRLKYFFWLNLTQEIPQFITTIAPFTVLAFGANLVIQGQLTLGSLIMFSQYVAMLFEPLNILSQTIVQKRSTEPIFDRVQRFLDTEDVKHSLPSSNNEKLVAIQNYTVNNKDQSLLFRIANLEIKHNGIYIFSGDNGVGKTTLLNLLAAVNSPEQLQPLDSSSYLHIVKNFDEQISYLYQPGFLFEGTVQENITFGEVNEPLLHEITKVLGINYLTKEISFNPINLSLGEQQKIFLARILFQNKDIILLDEPLSNLDHEARESLKRYMKTLSLTKTLLIITHDADLKQMADCHYSIKNQEFAYASLNELTIAT